MLSGDIGTRASYEDSERLRDGLEQCRQITRKYGTSFYFATQFFPREVREGIYAIYAFARIPDEIVDDPSLTDHDEAVARLNEWAKKLTIETLLSSPLILVVGISLGPVESVDPAFVSLIKVFLVIPVATHVNCFEGQQSHPISYQPYRVST